MDDRRGRGQRSGEGLAAGLPVLPLAGTDPRLAEVPDAARGQPPAAGGLAWTHYADFSDEADVRDGATRTAGANAVTYADGDELRIPDASGSRFVVVWVETVNRGDGSQYKRAYLMRHAAVWPGP